MTAKSERENEIDYDFIIGHFDIWSKINYIYIFMVHYVWAIIDMLNTFGMFLNLQLSRRTRGAITSKQLTNNTSMSHQKVMNCLFEEIYQNLEMTSNDSEIFFKNYKM